MAAIFLGLNRSLRVIVFADNVCGSISSSFLCITHPYPPSWIQNGCHLCVVNQDNKSYYWCITVKIWKNFVPFYIVTLEFVFNLISSGLFSPYWIQNGGYFSQKSNYTWLKFYQNSPAFCDSSFLNMFTIDHPHQNTKFCQHGRLCWDRRHLGKWWTWWFYSFNY